MCRNGTIMNVSKRYKGGDEMRNYLKNLRDSSKLSQNEVADSLGVSRTYYLRIENGERQKDLDLSILIKLSKLFNVSIDYIISEEEKLKEE